MRALLPTLGLQSDTEKKVAEGEMLDTIWEATIGNVGRVIYVFEVPTKGDVDGLLMNLLRFVRWGGSLQGP